MESLIEAIKKPHDKLFRDIFSLIECAIGFLQNNVPEKYLRGIDLNSLEVIKKNFINQELMESESDLIYKLRWKHREVYLYFMLEHQSSVDPLMALRMIEYQTRLWRQIPLFT